MTGAIAARGVFDKQLVPDSDHVRSLNRLANVARDYAVNSMGFPNNWMENGVIRLRAGAPIVEFAHTPQLPHLGVARMMLVAAREAKARDGVFLFCVNDHLPSDVLPECRVLPLSTQHGRIAKPPRFGPSKRLSRRAMACVPPPTNETLLVLQRRWTEIDSRRARKIEALALRMRHYAEFARSHAAWLTAVTLDVLGLTAVVLPTSRLSAAFPDAAEQLRAADPGSWWSHCASCGYRFGRWSTAPAACPQCASTDAPMPLPDVAARQALVNTIGLALRVCGMQKPYQAVADALRCLGTPFVAPPRLRVTGKSLFVDPLTAKTIERANLLQVAAGDDGDDGRSFTSWLNNCDADDWIVRPGADGAPRS